MLDIARSARLVAWGNAALAGRISPDTAAERISAGDCLHRVRGLAGEPTPVSLPLALARLRAGHVTGLRLALPVPGDPAGLPGPAEFNAAATEAGQAVLSVGGPRLGLLPSAEAYAGPEGRGARVIWAVHAVAGGPPLGSPTLAECERALKELLAEATSALLDMDVARWRPDLPDALEELRADRGMESALAPGYPPRAAAVLAMARRIGGIAALGAQDPGAAVSAGEMARRTAVLDALARSSRQAQVAAYNAVLEPRSGSRTA